MSQTTGTCHFFPLLLAGGKSHFDVSWQLQKTEERGTSEFSPIHLGAIREVYSGTISPSILQAGLFPDVGLANFTIAEMDFPPPPPPFLSFFLPSIYFFIFANKQSVKIAKINNRGKQNLGQPGLKSSRIFKKKKNWKGARFSQKLRKHLFCSFCFSRFIEDWRGVNRVITFMFLSFPPPYDWLGLSKGLSIAILK